MRYRILIIVVVLLAMAVGVQGYYLHQGAERLDRAQSQLADLKVFNIALSDDITALSGNISTLVSGVSSLAGEASRLKDDISGLKGDVSGLNRDIGGLRGDISNLIGTTGTLSANVSSLSQSIGKLQNDVTNSNKALESYLAAGTDTVTRTAPMMVLVEVSGLGFTASGSGIFIDKRGYILTAEHVISGASFVTITPMSGEKFPAAVVGTDIRRDLAILQVNAPHDFPVIDLGTAADIAVGREVMAIGFALGSDFGGTPTVTRGIVSAVRTIQGLKYIQTDAAVNPGNSGGALVTLDGKMIGVPSARVEGTTSQIELIGLAIPVDDARNFIGKYLR